MKTLALEIRDKGTFMPMIAIKMEPDNRQQAFLLRRAGFGLGSNLIMFGSMSGGQFHYDIYDWGDARTRKVAHNYIEQNFDKLKDGDVVDIEFILGESSIIKLSESVE